MGCAFAGRGCSAAKRLHQAPLPSVCDLFATPPTPLVLPPPKNNPAGDFIKYPSERRDAETLNMWVRTLTGTQ